MIDLDDVDTDEDGALTATAELPGGRRVTVEYEYDEELDRDDDDDDSDEDDDDEVVREDLPDLDVMEQTVRHALARLTADVLDARRTTRMSIWMRRCRQSKKISPSTG